MWGSPMEAAPGRHEGEFTMDNLILAMLSPQDMILLLVVAIFVFGPKRLPEIGEAFGKTISSFKGAFNEKPPAAASDESAKKDVAPKA